MNIVHKVQNPKTQKCRMKLFLLQATSQMEEKFTRKTDGL